MLRTQEEICLYVQDNINKKLPLDGPLWRIYLQDYEENGEMHSIIIWKSHHSFSDGVSVMSMLLSCSGEYDRSYFVKSQDLSFMQRIIVRLSSPF